MCEVRQKLTVVSEILGNLGCKVTQLVDRLSDACFQLSVFSQGESGKIQRISGSQIRTNIALFGSRIYNGGHKALTGSFER